MLLEVSVPVAEEPHGAQEPQAEVERDPEGEGKALREVEVQGGDGQGEPGRRRHRQEALEVGLAKMSRFT